MCITKRKTVAYLQYVYNLEYVYHKEENCVMPAICLSSWFCVSQRGKLRHTYNMFIILILCITKRETVAYLQYVYNLDLLYQKERNCTMSTVCLWARFCVPENGRLYHSYSIFIILILCIRKRETILCLQYVYHLERGKLYHTYSMFLF